MALRWTVVKERRIGAVDRVNQILGRLGRRGHAVAARRSAFFAAAFIATIFPLVATSAEGTPPRAHTIGARARLCIHSGLSHALESDDRLLLRMTSEDTWVLNTAVKHGLALDKAMVTLSSGSPIPTDCRLALGLRILAMASYLNVTFSFGVSRCMVCAIFHQVCAPLIFVLSSLSSRKPG